MKRKYIPHLATILARCERNYAMLLRLLPDCDTIDLTYRFDISSTLRYQIRIIESTRYTSVISFAQIDKHTPTFLQPNMEVRLYHDARVAEVTKSQKIGRLKPRYDYPNQNMHQRNEREMVSRFLGEWLAFCLHHQNNKKSA